MPKIIISLLIGLFLTSAYTHAQNLIEIINQSQKAKLLVQSHNAFGDIVSEACGFIISGDGFAIIPSSILTSSDSISLKTHNGRLFGIYQIIQIHPQANLALIKITVSRNRDFDFLRPSKQLTKVKQDLLVIGHADDMEDGMVITKATDIRYQLLLNRVAVLAKPMTKKSFGAPVINSAGEWVGVINAYTKESPAIALSSNIINDTCWIPVNLSPQKLSQTTYFASKLKSDYNEGLYNMAILKYDKAAQAFTKYLQLETTDVVAYNLRAYARYNYNNTFGAKEDYLQAKKLNPNFFLNYYYAGLQMLADDNQKEAMVNFTICNDKKPDFVNAMVERGKLHQTVTRDLQSSLTFFNNAIKIDSTYGAAYYEKARFALQYLDDKKLALDDINKAIELDPNQPGAYSIRGTILISEQNYLLALNDLEIATIKNPQDLSALFNKGVAEYNLGMKDKACSDWEKAARMGHYKAAKFVSQYCSVSKR